MPILSSIVPFLLGMLSIALFIVSVKVWWAIGVSIGFFFMPTVFFEAKCSNDPAVWRSEYVIHVKQRREGWAFPEDKIAGCSLARFENNYHKHPKGF